MPQVMQLKEDPPIKTISELVNFELKEQNNLVENDALLLTFHVNRWQCFFL